MPRDTEYLLDILETAKLASAYVEGKTREEFFMDSQCQDAVIRRLEIIGEAHFRRNQGQTSRSSVAGNDPHEKSDDP